MCLPLRSSDELLVDSCMNPNQLIDIVSLLQPQFTLLGKRVFRLSGTSIKVSFQGMVEKTREFSKKALNATPSKGLWVNALEDLYQRLQILDQQSRNHCQRQFLYRLFGWQDYLPQNQRNRIARLMRIISVQIERKKSLLDYPLVGSLPREYRKENCPFSPRLSTIEERIRKNLAFAYFQGKQESENPAIRVSTNGSLADHMKIISYQGIEQYFIGACSYIGKKNRQEDFYFFHTIYITIKRNRVPISLFAVCDGHSGSGAARFVSDNAHGFLANELIKNCGKGFTEEGIWNALKTSCQQMHNECVSTTDSGTTLVLACIIRDSIWIANVGDSRAFLIQGNYSVQLTEDARPEIPRYKRKIERNGGSITEHESCWRINEGLNIARTIGDGRYGTIVSPKPKITRLHLKEVLGATLVLATDGFTNALSNNQAAEILSCMKYSSLPDQAQALVESAYYSGSRDNITTMVIRFAS